MVDKFNTDWLADNLKKSEYVKTTPRKWTDKELNWCLEARKQGISISEIAEILGRSEVSVFVKLKRHSKNSDNYNSKYRDLKYQANANFGNLIEPKNVLDVYAANSWWATNGYSATTNDKSTEFECDYNLDALALLATLWLEKKKFDLIDLDPFGSAYECFDFAMRMARKGVIISFGEWGHKRWKRLDFVQPRYGINSIDDFVENKFIAEAQKIARRHKKKLVPVETLQYSNFLRVYFSIEPFKEISQWEKN